MGAVEMMHLLASLKERSRGGWAQSLLTALAAGLALPLSATAQQLSAVDLRLVLCVDVSSSMSAAEQRLQREGYVSALRDPRSPAIDRDRPAGQDCDSLSGVGRPGRPAAGDALDRSRRAARRRRIRRCAKRPADGKGTGNLDLGRAAGSRQAAGGRAERRTGGHRRLRGRTEQCRHCRSSRCMTYSSLTA